MDVKRYDVAAVVPVEVEAEESAHGDWIKFEDFISVLSEFREAVECWRHIMRDAAQCGVLTPEMEEDARADVDKADRLLALIGSQA